MAAKKKSWSVKQLEGKTDLAVGAFLGDELVTRFRSEEEAREWVKDQRQPAAGDAS